MKNKIQISTIVIGLLLAAAVVCSHVFHLIAEPSIEKGSKTEQTETSGEDFTFTTAPTTTPPASAHVHSNLLAYLIFEIIQPQTREVTRSTNPSTHAGKLLLTLFRVIISPNAP
jgi:hypothetical protein